MRVRTNKPQISVGDTFETNCNGTIEVVEYVNANKILVRFLDTGHERYSTSGNIQKGKVKDAGVPPKNCAKRNPSTVALEVDKVYTSYAGHDFAIVSYKSASNIDIKFLKSGYECNVTANAVRTSHIEDHLETSRSGFGYIGVGKYSSKEDGEFTKEYSLWSSMLSRCYYYDYTKKFPTYEDANVCEEWRNFQVFAEWCQSQVGFKSLDEKGKPFNLDKDILVKGNKVYSPSTCIFVPFEINGQFTKANTRRGSCPIGVSYAALAGKFLACVRENNKTKHLGYHLTKEAAFRAYKRAKESYLQLLAEKHKDVISPEAYIALYNYKVEITD